MLPRILLVDDVPVVRTSLRSLLATGQMEVCGEAENGQQAMAKVMELKPDVVILDITMPVMDGLKATMEIRRIAPGTKVVLFTIHDGSEAKTAAQIVGADALVPKGTASRDLLPVLLNLTRVH
jgi:DNA-binding NarL/FixJ family response regulator